MFWFYMICLTLSLLSLAGAIYWSPKDDQLPRWGAILWFLIAFIPIVNLFSGALGTITMFMLPTVQDWLSRPVRRD